MDGWMRGWMDGCVDGWMDGWIDEWMDCCFASHSRISPLLVKFIHLKNGQVSVDNSGGGET
jgi:hypothetical protein